VQGLAWEAEIAFDNSIFCYPYRKGFVYATEHTAWDNDLKRAFGDRENKPLAMEEFARWARGAYDETQGRLAWGFVHFLAGKKGDALASALEDLRVFRDVHDRKDGDNDTWTRIPGYQIPVEDQLAIFKKRFGDDVLDAASAAFRK